MIICTKFNGRTPLLQKNSGGVLICSTKQETTNKVNYISRITQSQSTLKLKLKKL